jgi:hypothetical protein
MFTLAQVVPWGRSFDEYRRMFALTEDDLALNILGCGDGPASFNAELTRRGGRVTSCDPIYRFSAGEIEGRIAESFRQIVDQTTRNADRFVWQAGIASVEALASVRMAAMRRFLDDFESGRTEGRYATAELPTLPHEDEAFDLALCSHFLFLYSSHLDEAFHQASVGEMCRVAKEVRVFPLVTLDGTRSPFVDPCLEWLQARGHEAQIETVPYEFQRGGNQMLRVRARRGNRSSV